MTGAGLAAASPWIAGALGGLGGYLSSGSEGKLGPFGGVHTQTDPETLLSGYLGDLGRTGGIAAQRATRPTSLPSAYVQPLPIFKGAGAVESVSAGALDPGYTQPELLTRGGVDFGAGQAPFQQIGAGETYATARQPDVYSRFTSGGLSEMEDALGLLGVNRDAYGRLMFGANLGQRNLPEVLNLAQGQTHAGSGSGWSPMDPMSQGDGGHGEGNTASGMPQVDVRD
jgi:hypothetical protein